MLWVKLGLYALKNEENMLIYRLSPKKEDESITPLFIGRF
jgi:hypothetical protein